jgi:hypothetical protein
LRQSEPCSDRLASHRSRPHSKRDVDISGAVRIDPVGIALWPDIDANRKRRLKLNCSYIAGSYSRLAELIGVKHRVSRTYLIIAMMSSLIRHSMNDYSAILRMKFIQKKTFYDMRSD